MKILPDTLLLPQRTLTGPGVVTNLLPECARFGDRGLLVHGRSVAAGGALDRIRKKAPATLVLRTWPHPGDEPAVAEVEALLEIARAHGTQWVAAVGGGSTLDLAKACAGLLNAPLAVEAYHDGAPLPESRTPFVAAPTTAGTGTEATMVSVLTNTATGVKKSFRHSSHIARTVFLDPEMLATCPPHVIAASGMDAFTQAFEPYISKGASKLTDALAMEAMQLVAGHIEPAFRGEGGEHLAALQQGSYLAGLALSHARLGLVHGLAHPLGARYHAPHGLVCAICLPHVIEFNRPACESRYAAVRAALGEDPLDLVNRLLTSLRLASPFTGKPVPDAAAIVQETLESGSTAANPRPVSGRDVENVLERLFG